MYINASLGPNECAGNSVHNMVVVCQEFVVKNVWEISVIPFRHKVWKPFNSSAIQNFLI